MTSTASSRAPAGRARASRRPDPPAASSRLRVLAGVALVPVLGTYAAVVVLAALIAAFASGTTPGGEPGLAQALATGVPLWLAVHLVPLDVAGAPLGMLPLGPACGVAALVAWTARRGAYRLAALPGTHDPVALRERVDRWPSVAVPVVATVTAVHAAAGVLASALLTPDAATVPADASPVTAGTVVGLLAGVAATAGVAGPCGAGRTARRLPDTVRRGVRAGLAAVAALAAGGAAVLLVALLAHADAVAAVFAAVAPEAGSGAGLWALDVAYLPNAAVAALAWLLGPGYAVGGVVATPTTAVPGLVPPVPLAALLPAGPPPVWAGLVFAVPLAVGSAVGWVLGPTGRTPGARAGAVGVAAVTAATVLAGVAALAGGRLGAGPFDPVSIPPGGVALAAAAWVGVPGLAVALLATPTATPTVSAGPTVSAAPTAGPDVSGAGPGVHADEDRVEGDADAADGGRATADAAGASTDTPGVHGAD